MRRFLSAPRWARCCLRGALALIALAACLDLYAPPQTRAGATNLIGNPGFEQGADGWELCGTAELPTAGAPGVTAAMVYAGSRALRLTYSDTDTCGSPVFDPHGAAAQAVTIPVDAQDVTISFWYSRVGNPIWDLTISLAEPGGFGYLDSVYTDNLPGWHLYRYELTLDQLERVRGRTALLTLASQYSPATRGAPDADGPGFYIDAVRVVATRERTEEAPRPANLRSDGTAPIVYLDGRLGGIARMEADGSGARLLYKGSTPAFSPAWSSAGDRVAVVEGLLTPEGNTSPTVNPARISRIVVVDAGSGAAREVYRTAGLAGNRPSVPTPGNPERPALDIVASSVTWSPDDQQLALALCSTNRAANGTTSDPICWVERVAVATGVSLGRLEPGFAPRWSRANQIIYSNEDSYQAKPQGIYEATVSGGLVSERLLVPGLGSQFRPAAFTDRLPAWSPDGTQFVTVRNISGFHYDDQGRYTVHYAIMRFTRGDPLGRQVLLVDQGVAPSNLTWSPDGTLLLYTLYQERGAEIWWLDMRTGATGRLITGGAAADWRLRAAPGPSPFPHRIYLPIVGARP
jgi:Tol biopolymer transport system component